MTFPSARGITFVYNGVTFREPNLGPLVLSMSRNDAFQLQDARLADLTGTRITSNNPVAVFTGNRFFSIVPTRFTDFVVAQIPATSTYGTNFVLPLLPIQGVLTNVKVVANEDGTYVTISGGVANRVLLNRGYYREWRLPQGQYVTVTSSAPILVSFWIQESGSGGNGQPALIIIPPLSQYLQEVYFTTPQASTELYMMVVTERRYSSTVLFDGAPLAAAWQSVPESELVGFSRSIAPGSHVVNHRDANARLAAFVYGYNSRQPSCGYAYAAGMCLNRVGGVSAC